MSARVNNNSGQEIKPSGTHLKRKLKEISPANLSFIFQPTTERDGDRDRYFGVWWTIGKEKQSSLKSVYWFDYWSDDCHIICVYYVLLMNCHFVPSVILWSKYDHCPQSLQMEKLMHRQWFAFVVWLGSREKERWSWTQENWPHALKLPSILLSRPLLPLLPFVFPFAYRLPLKISGI